MHDRFEPLTKTLGSLHVHPSFDKHVVSANLLGHSELACVCMHVCMFVCMYVCIYIYIYIYIYIAFLRCHCHGQVIVTVIVTVTGYHM